MMAVRKLPLEQKFLSLHCSIDDIESKDQFNIIVKRLTATEQQKVMRFRLYEDQRRALLSILLQRKVIRDTFKLSDTEYQIARTHEGKPYLKLPGKSAGSWNFNVSHHGKYVSIAADPNLLVGVDIVDILTRSPSAKASCTEYIKMFSGQLTSSELNTILKQVSDDDKFTCFYIIWSLKESYIKAIGLGLGFDLSQINFEIQFEVGSSFTKGTAVASIKGTRRQDWTFEFFALDERHVMSVARGPIADALPSYAEAAQLRASPLESVRNGKSVGGKHYSTRVSSEQIHTSSRTRQSSIDVFVE